jgi:para-nitrobenzyl esterase
MAKLLKSYTLQASPFTFALLPFTFFGTALAFLLLLVPLGSRAEELCSAPVATAEGPVTGRAAETAACEYRGIPYAAPPKGERRWRPPAPAAARTATLAAQEFGPQCPQPHVGLTSLLPSGTESEDCLYLNIWRPLKSGSFPVMVWIHGGDLLQGSGSWPLYAGDRLAAAKDVVVVSINYRLGPLGFLYHPALAAEDPHRSSGNYGLLDQVQSLAWVRDNIAGFGGDPQNVTIFGESAGGWSVCNLLASPLAAGLFHRAIVESGGCQCSRTVAQGEEWGREFAARLGCEGPKAAACLRTKSARQVIAALGTNWQAMLTKFFPHLDGYALAESPLDAVRGGRYNRVPLLAGSTRDEFKLFANEIPGGRLLPGPLIDRAADRYLRARLDPPLGGLYPTAAYSRPADALFDAIGDAYLACPTWRAAAAAAPHQPRTWYYRFDYDAHLAPDMIGAAHGTEVPFVFGAGDREPVNILYSKPQWERARPLMAAIMSYWTNFAASGDPNGPGLPPWPAYTADGQERLRLDEPIRADRADLEPKCAYWDRQAIVIH